MQWTRQGARTSGQPIGWRRQVWRSFDDKLSRRGLFHPALLPAKIVQRLAGMEREPRFRAKWPLLASNLPAIGKNTFWKSCKREPAQYFSPFLPATPSRNRLVYTDPEQEITGLMENLLISVREHAPHEIAVVLCDSRILQPGCFKPAPGYTRRARQGQLAAYNLCPDLNLCGQGLYNAAVLPIRCALGGEKRNDLFTFSALPILWIVLHGGTGV